jgi:hypothetical protein
MYEFIRYTFSRLEEAGYHDFAMNHSEDEITRHIWKVDQQLAKDFANVMGMNGIIKELKEKTGQSSLSSKKSSGPS